MRSATATADAQTMDIQPEIAQSLGRELETQTKAAVLRLASITVTDAPACQQAVLDRQDIGDRIKAVEAFFEPFKSLAHKLHKALCSRENEILLPLRGVDQTLLRAIGDYKLAEDRKRRLEEQRLADERRQQDETRVASEAAALESQGETALAAAVLEEALSAPAPVIVLPDATKSIDGLKFRRTWKWRYINDDKARALSLIPREYLTVDESRLSKYATAMKETAKVPGIQFYYEDVPVRF